MGPVLTCLATNGLGFVWTYGSYLFWTFTDTKGIRQYHKS